MDKIREDSLERSGEHYGPYGTACAATGQLDAGFCWKCQIKKLKEENQRQWKYTQLCRSHWNSPKSSRSDNIGCPICLWNRIEELEAKRDAGYEAGWHALRQERDELKATIEQMEVFMQREIYSIGPKPDFKQTTYWDLFITEQEQKDE